MAMDYCTRHDRHWDRDWYTACPDCLIEPKPKPKRTTFGPAVERALAIFEARVAALPPVKVTDEERAVRRRTAARQAWTSAIKTGCAPIADHYLASYLAGEI